MILAQPDGFYVIKNVCLFENKSVCFDLPAGPLISSTRRGAV